MLQHLQTSLFFALSALLITTSAEAQQLTARDPATDAFALIPERPS
jgi:hypothetical protein